MTPLRARTSAWLLCKASPFCGSRVAGRHLEPVPREMTLMASPALRTNPAKTVNWPSGGLNFNLAYVESTRDATSSAGQFTIHSKMASQDNAVRGGEKLGLNSYRRFGEFRVGARCHRDRGGVAVWRLLKCDPATLHQHHQPWHRDRSNESPVHTQHAEERVGRSLSTKSIHDGPHDLQLHHSSFMTFYVLEPDIRRQLLVLSSIARTEPVDWHQTTHVTSPVADPSPYFSITMPLFARSNHHHKTSRTSRFRPRFGRKDPDRVAGGFSG